MRPYCLIPLIVLLMSNNCLSQKYIWERVYLGNTGKNNIVGIDNFDSLNIMIADVSNDYPPPGYNLVLKSTDAGITWDTVYKGLIFKDSLIQALSISYPTKDLCIVGTHKNYIIKTKDGGKNWTSKKIDIKYYGGLRELDMLDDKHGVTFDYRNMVITHDGFETYKVVPPPMNGNYRHAKLFSPNEIFIIFWDILKPHGDTNHIIFRTTNEGESWEKIGVIVHPYFWSHRMKFVDNDLGFIVGGMQVAIGMNVSNVIYKTTDGGNNWRLVLDTVVPWNAWGIQEIDVLDRNTAIATSQFGVVYWTHDGGESWQLDSNAILREGIPATLYPCLLGKHTALIADFNDRISRSSLNPLDVEDVRQDVKMGIIYPNPASEFITINPGNEGLKPFAETDEQVEIYNSFGELVLADVQHLRDVGHLRRIDISHLPVGLYFVKIGDRVEKFVKM